MTYDPRAHSVWCKSPGVSRVSLYSFRLRWFFFPRAVIGEIDEETDSTLDLKNIRAEPLNSVVH